MSIMKTLFPEGILIKTQENLQNISSPERLLDAARSGEILEAVATVCDSEHNLIVPLGNVKGVIPKDEGAMVPGCDNVRDIALISRVGKPVCFTVTEMKKDSDGKAVAMLSRRNAEQRCYNEYISRLMPGDVINARVTHLEGFGAFCDIGCGFIALLPIDSISVSRISHPADRFKVGDDIKAVVKSIDECGRVTLSFKELLGTWEENAALFSPGETVSGIVRSALSYGVFVELAPNLAGLADIKEGIKTGQGCSVFIKSILKDKMKVKLIIIDTYDVPAARPPIRYFCNDDHIDYWHYSPTTSEKQIETVF